MSNYYPYIMATLPLLQFGAKAPISSEKLLEMCGGIVSDGDMEKIRMAYLPADADIDSSQPTLKMRRDFETALRNELVRLRAPKRHVEPLKYLREDGNISPGVMHIAFQASKANSLIESEKLLDEERWRTLEELEVGHYFDVDRVIIYACKLSLLEKWDSINSADREGLLETALR